MMKKWLNAKIFCDNKKTLFFVGMASFFVLFAYQMILFSLGYYFNSGSDDVAQYSPILLQYINYFKDGNFSFYNFTNNSGASIFADTYYVPIDIFSLLVFLLSYVVDGTIAFSIVNLSKVFFGVLVFAYFLQRKGFKNWLVCLLSLMYFSFGGSWTLVTYPTYFSLFFYLPLSLLILDYYRKGKKWIMPLYSFLLVLYNFYNAYTLFVFMVLIYIVVEIRDSYLGIKKLVANTFVLGLNIVLGVIMGMFLFLPSLFYIVNYTDRTKANFEFFYEIDVCVSIVSRLFVSLRGIDSIVSGDYVHFQFNYYIGTIGLFLLLLMFMMKDRVSKIYKYSLLCVLLMMVIPVFSMLFSGVGIAYTRWFNFINIILIYMVGHVLSNFDFSCLKKKTSLSIIGGMVSIYFICFIYNMFYILVIGEQYKDIFNSVVQFLIFVLFGIALLLFTLFFIVKKKELIASVFAFEMITVIIMNLSVSFNDFSKESARVYKKLDSVVHSVRIDKNDLNRVYIAADWQFNLSRYMDTLSNENSFHSFMTKYVYDYLSLFGEKENYLVTNYLNRINPYSNRIMDYKYVIVDEEIYNCDLDYLKYLYSNNGYKVYENVNYEPFYVYESYYHESDVLDASIDGDVLGLERNLLKGVILDGDYRNLEKLSFNYNNSKTNRIDMYKKADQVIDFSLYNSFDYEGKIYFKIEDSEEIKEIKLKYIDDREEVCDNLGNIIKCNYSKDIKEIVVDGDYSDLKYLVTVNVDDEEYVLVLLEGNKDYKYLNYYLNMTKNSYDVILKNGVKEERYCFNGICNVDDYVFDHVLVNCVEHVYSVDNENLYFDYYYDNLEEYFANVENNLVSDKKLTYNKSTIQVEYVRESDSKNNQVIVLPVTYSDEWEIEDSNDNYELVRANGGFLGVLVKNNVKNIQVNIKFKPSGVKIGLVGSFVGVTIYIIYCIYLRRKKDIDENI